MPLAFMELVAKQVLCGRKSNRLFERPTEVSFCYVRGDVVFNKIMVSLDFFCFVFVIKQKNESLRFVATEAPLLRRRNEMKEENAI